VLADGGAQVVEYSSLANADYVTNAVEGRFTLALTAAIGELEYQARVLAMIRVYRALGVNLAGSFQETVKQKARWTVLSFRRIDPADAEARQAETDAGVELQPGVYRFEVFLRGAARPSPDVVGKTRVEVRRSALLLVDPVTVLLKDGAAPWRRAG
jgi:hypothetical protein